MSPGDSYKEVKAIDGIEVVQHAPEVDSRYHKVDSGPANILATK